MARIKFITHTIISLTILLSTVTFVFSAATSVMAESKTKSPDHILVLHSYHSGFPGTDYVMSGIQDVLFGSLEQIHMDVEYLDVKRNLMDLDTARMLDAVLVHKLKNRAFDLVLASGNEALEYALKHRTDIFRGTPIVSCDIVSDDFGPSLSAGHTSVSSNPDFAGVINQALAFHPRSSTMLVIGGTHDLADRLNTQRLMAIAQTFALHITFDFWNDVPAETIIERLKSVAPGTIILINGSVRDKTGHLLSFHEQTELLRGTHLPLYSFWDVYLDEGIVGGPLLNMREQGRIAARTALKTLSGEQVTHNPSQQPVTTQTTFDYNELQRLGIPLASLPIDHLLVNAPQPFYKLSKTQLVWSGALLFSSLSITIILTWSILLHRRTEMRLRQSEQNYRHLSQQFQIILDGIPDSLTLISPDMKVQWSNKGAGAPFGATLRTVPGEYCCEMLYNRTSLCDNCPAVKAFQSGNSEESIITTPDNRTLEVKAFPVRNGDDEISYVIMLACDITEKTRLLEEATRTRRLVALGELAAGVAHEINNPNALILLNAGLLRKACGDAAPILQKHYEQSGDFQLAGMPYSEMCCELPHLFKEMFESAGRIKNIVNDLKDFSFADAQDLRESIDLNQVVQKVILMLDNTILAATNNLTIEITEKLPYFFGNRQHIEQILINLIMNACQALNEKEKGLYISTWFHPERNSCLIMVRDEGVGISKENMIHITDPFFTTKRQSGGTGLGLSVSLRIVKNYGGSLEFQSVLNKGTTAYLFLPIKQEAIEQ